MGEFRVAEEGICPWVSFLSYLSGTRSHGTEFSRLVTLGTGVMPACGTLMATTGLTTPGGTSVLAKLGMAIKQIDYVYLPFHV